MGDMMPDDIPHTDDKAKRKIHPGAMGCFIISLVSVGLLVGGLVLLFIVNSLAEDPFFLVFGIYALLDAWATIIWGLIVWALLVSSFLAQFFGIALGIWSLLEMREDRLCRGKGYAIAGITISTLVFLALLFTVIPDSS
ncbi:MAG: hypothetical protein J7M40_15500 [Planctomycetes bacterium]|nr:hypothetical protein [Planctomycetota bacterium]